MKKINKVFLAILLIPLVTIIVYAKAIYCTGQDTVVDNGFAVVGQVSFSTENDCCTPASGSALVTKSFYLNGSCIATAFYYITITEAQQAMSCQFT